MAVETLTCPECNAPLERPAGRAEFACMFCGSTVVARSLAAVDSPKAAKSGENVLRPKVDLSAFEIATRGEVLTITFVWRSLGLLFLIPFTVFWNGVIGVGATTFFSEVVFGHHPGDGVARIIGPIFMIPFILVGVSLIYFCVATIFNRTVIRVDRNWLKVVHGPIPWKSPSPIRVESIEQVYVKQHLSNSDSGPSQSYQLMVLCKNGSTVGLLKPTHEEGIPKAFERLIEDHLGITDQAVQGEHR